MKRPILFAGLALVTLAMAGCQTASDAARPVGPEASATSGIDGNWVDPNGIMSTFRNGTFETRSTDNNSLLATGTYTQVAGNSVQIEMHSILRNTDSSVACAQVGPAQLNCTSNTGSHFSLRRAG